MDFVNSLRVGFFLAGKAIWRSNRYVTILIIIILTLIFLNLVAIGGLLLGLIKGSETGYIKTLSGTLVIEPLRDKSAIQYADQVIDFAKSLPGFLSYSPRFQAGAKIENNYKETKLGSSAESTSASIVGIDPQLERQTTDIADKIVEGRFLQPGDRDSIVLGAILAGRGATIAIGESLTNVYVGDKLRVIYGNGATRDYTLVGIFKSKNNLRNLQALVTNDELRDILAIKDDSYAQIAIRTDNPLAADQFKQYFINAGYDQYNVIKTWSEALGSAISDIDNTMELIGNIVGGIGLIVGGITIFILIFVNAISKRRFIGILKAGGVTSASITISYVLQGIFYTVIAVLIGCFILFGIMVPYVNIHPIDFPFADGILYVPFDYVTARVIVLFVVSIFSGFVPAYMITRENTLNAILGR